MTTAPEEAPKSIDALERADRLEATGEFRAAAEILEALPRDVRDTSIDVRIVRLRHQAFAELPHGPTPDPEPGGTPPDLWPNVVDAPELPAADLTLETLTSAVYHHGCLIVRGLLPAHGCEAFRADIDEALAAFDDYEMARPAKTAPWYVPFDAGNRFRGARSLRHRVPARRAVAPTPHTRLGPSSSTATPSPTRGSSTWSATTSTGSPCSSVNKFVLRRVSGGAEPAWHQDGGYLGISSRALNLWVALSECGADTELMGLDILPGRRRELAEVGTFDAVERRAISPTVASRLAQETERPVVRPLFHPGDAILFDQYFVHRSDIRPLARDRYAIESWFFSARDYPDHLVPVVAG